MSSSAICSHFTQNAWKKDLCSNCFKSKEEHKQAGSSSSSSSSSSASSFAHFSSSSSSSLLAGTKFAGLRSQAGKATTAAEGHEQRKTDYPNRHRVPTKSIIKKSVSVCSLTTTTTTTTTNSHSKSSKSKSHKVSFRKVLSEVIGYGGEWSDNDSDDDDDHDFMNLANDRDDLASASTDDEEALELKRITRANTDFNMNNGNLLGDPQENIKRSFAALKLGAPQVDKEGKKQTLKINVVPFGASANAPATAAAAATAVKAKFETKSATAAVTTTTSTISVTPVSAPASSSASMAKSSITLASAVTASDSDGKNSPPIERAMEKSLLDEISETLEQKQQQQQQQQQTEAQRQTTVMTTTTTASATKIKFEIGSLNETPEAKSYPELKKPIARNPPITKEHAKPKINVFHKYSDTDSNCSDGENSISAYYDVVETQISYENLPDGKAQGTRVQSMPARAAESNDTKQSSPQPLPPPPQSSSSQSTSSTQASLHKQQAQPKSKLQAQFSSTSQYITDMLLSSKTRAASYSLHEGNFITSKITADGLIVTKCSSDDALDSTGSSFDGSSDEEASYNMIRSESDSGIGISIGSDYKNMPSAAVQERERAREKARISAEQKLSASTNNSDYEDIQVADQLALPAASNAETKKANFILEKSRELHGEPDGSADPDGSLESKDAGPQQQAATSSGLPELPKSPPPTKLIDARPSFLHGLQKQHPPLLLKKPDLPAKPLVTPAQSPLKTFIAKRQATTAEQQVISQLQLIMAKSGDTMDSCKEDAKLRKGRAPNPPPEHKSSAPPTPERDYNVEIEFGEATSKPSTSSTPSTPNNDTQSPSPAQPNEPQPQAKQSNESKTSSTAGPAPAQVDAKLSAELQQQQQQQQQPQPQSQAESPESEALSEGSVPSSVTAAAAATSGFARKSSPNAAANTSAACGVVREKEKRERVIINPKFRSLNSFVTQRHNAAKNAQLQAATPSATSSASSATMHPRKPMTPEPTPRHQQHSKAVLPISMSEECLAAAAEDKKAAAPAKAKTKFSIKKFLRMGASKTSDQHQLHKKDAGYTEICTGDEAGVVGKPRLVIIHPIDINPTAVEVVKDITKTNDSVTPQTVAVVTSKPPAPPLRADAQRAHELNKPARPPPPKSGELRRKQQISLSTTITGSEASGSVKCKADNVYANLGEIRSAIAPRKPERTASMREREAQLELVRKRHGGAHNENVDSVSICSSNGETVSADHQAASKSMGTDAKPPAVPSRTSTFERKKGDTKITIASKLEIFEAHNESIDDKSDSRPGSLKDSVRKINSTIDSYLKDKRDYENMYEFGGKVAAASTAAPLSPPPPPLRSVGEPQRALLPPRRPQLYSDTASVASYTRSEFGPSRSYGFNGSLANIPRVISASYCGSEVGEFDIYAPYSYYGSEAGGDVAADINDSVWGIPQSVKSRAKATNRLRMRKGRSVVHKNIEDNYTAVVVANHEALAQVLDQLQQTPVIPPALRPLANAINLRFEDFTVLDGAQAFVVGKKAFHAAIWTSVQVTLALSADCNQLSGVGGELNQLSGGVSGVLNPITEFCDLVPSYHLPLMPSTEVTLMQATISVLPRIQLDTLQSIGSILKGKSQVLDKSNFNFRGSIPNLSGNKEAASAGSALRNVVSVQNLSTLNEETSLEKSVALAGEPGGESDSLHVTTLPGMPAFDDVMTREVAFIMLQLVNGMKNLQAKAIEEMPLSLSNVVLSKDVENKDAQARLCVLQGNSNNDEDEPMGTLCKCAHIALTEMLPATRITPLLADILLQERAESLSKAKSVLEFVLWGPSDVVLSGSIKERELALQRWLDLERATVLHGLVRTRVELTIYDECHLMFLVRSTAKMMNDAAKIVCSYQQATSEQKV